MRVAMEWNGMGLKLALTNMCGKAFVMYIGLLATSLPQRRRRYPCFKARFMALEPSEST